VELTSMGANNSLLKNEFKDNFSNANCE